MADLVQSIRDMLKEETYTRATISNYTQSDIEQLAVVIDQAKKENAVSEIKTICQDHLSHAKDSIIALYITGILDVQEGSLDNSSLEILVDIFQKNHKESIVVYLCESILNDDPNNKFALRTLADIYMAENNDKVWELYDKLVKIDFSEADLAKLLAEHYEASDVKKAVEYYKKAIIRYINMSNYGACKEVWSKLVSLVPEDFDFFQLLRRKIAKTMGEIKTTNLMQELYDYYKDNGKWDIAITILKQNLDVDQKDTWARKAITDCYREKYKDNQNVENYIRSSNLTQSYRNVFEAINDFEKHIAFTKGKHVFHRSWGVGKILKLENDTLTINFGRTGGVRTMKLEMAVTALKPLENDHIWVLKAYDKNHELKDKVKSDVAWGLETIIKSFDNSCDFKRIKAELVPSILDTKEWTSWNTKAKKELEENPKFGVNPSDSTQYIVREGAIPLEEKLSNEFKAQKQFFARADIIMKFFEDDTTDKSSEYFTEMYTYFTGYLKNIYKVDEQTLSAYLIVKYIGTVNKELAFPVKETFAQIYSKIDDPSSTYLALKDTKNTHLRNDFINDIKLLPDWQNEYIKLFPTVLDKALLAVLIDAGFKEDVQKLVRTVFEQYKDYRETAVFLFKECQEDKWYQEAGVPMEKQLITLLNIIVLTFREINSHVNTTDNKKINKNATTLLFEDEYLFNFIFAEGKTEDTVKKFYTMVDDIADLDPQYKQITRNKILEKYPDFKIRVSEEKSQKQNTGMLVTAKKHKEKKEEAERLQNVDLPNNAQDIADAKAKGDLKENSEYKAARELQHMLQLRLATLQSELARAVIFDPTTCTTSVVSFATIVTLTNNDTGKDETYTILGPWESDPQNNVLSYLSPFGTAIMDKKVGETAKFTVNERKCNYTVKEIKKFENF